MFQAACRSIKIIYPASGDQVISRQTAKLSNEARQRVHA